jgi:Polycystin cation channel
MGWIVVYIFYMIVSATDVQTTDANYNEHKILLTMIKCSIVILTFMKLAFYLRIFDGLGFLVQMMQSVLKDLANFLFFFGIFVAFCGVFMSIIMSNMNEDYPQMGELSFFIVAFRMSIGDFATDSFAHNEE